MSVECRKGNYLNSKVIAPPSLVLPDAPDLDRANLTLEFHVPDSLAQTEVASNANGDGFMCAILQLQTPNVTLGTSASWDLNNCTVEIISTSTLQCHCSAVGTTLLLHVRAFPMVCAGFFYKFIEHFMRIIYLLFDHLGR